MKIIIDNGHGCDTPGKCSPDRRLREWEWNREVARRIYHRLRHRRLDATMLVTTDHDVPLRERVRRVNEMCRRELCLLLSVHANAAGADGQWHSARGWSVYVSPNSSQASRELARCLRDQARQHTLDLRQPLPTQPFWVKSLAMLRDTVCPAVLTENMFMDNQADCEWMLTDRGKDTIADIHVRGVLDYLQLCDRH